jgi:hypothetical protein
VTTDMDTLATALYVRCDDLLKDPPQLAPWCPAAGIDPQLSDAELVTLAVLQALLGFTSEARWLRYARAHLTDLFPYLPQQPGYNKRLRRAAALIRHCIRVLAASTTLWTDDVWVVDSKGQLDLERHGGHTPAGVTVRVLQRILALTAAIWHNDTTGQPVMRSLTAYDH